MAGRIGALIAVAVFVGIAGTARGATFTIDDVADLVDQNPGDGVCATAASTCTLRAAIQEANALPGKDNIVVKDDLEGGVTLTIPGAGEDAAATGDLDITDDVDMNGLRPLGPGYGFTMGVDAAGLDRVFHILPGVTATVYYFAIFNGSVGAGENGGGILNEGTLDGNIYVTVCSAGGDGGGLYNSGVAEMSSRYTLNTAGGRGGAIANVGTLELERDLYYASIGRNSAASGGGVYNAGTLTANAISLIENNATAGAGGGLLNDAGGVAHLANLTIGGNTTTSGGVGLDNVGSADLAYVTLNGNGALGLSNDDGAGATTSARASILVDGCAGTVTSGGYNITQGCALAGVLGSDQVDVDPGIESHASCAARYFGQICPHYRPERGSAAIDAGDPANCKDGFGVPLATDQDAVPRPIGSVCDAGAIESVPVCVGGATTVKAKMVISGIGAGPGRQSIRYVGRINDSNIPRLNFFGAQLLVEDLGSGAALVERANENGDVLGGGGVIPFTCHVWKRTSSGYSYREVDKNCPNPSTNGLIRSIKVKDPAVSGKPSGNIDLKFSVTKITAAVPTGALHMAFTYGHFAHMSANGVCAETTFGPTACVASGSRVKCLLF